MLEINVSDGNASFDDNDGNAFGYYEATDSDDLRSREMLHDRPSIDTFNREELGAVEQGKPRRRARR